MQGNLIREMARGTVVSYDENPEWPRAVLALGNGDHIALSLARDRLTIAQVGQSEDVLFEAHADLTSRLCAGLISANTARNPPPLRVLVAAAVQMNSAAEIKRAFEEAADTLS
jgi:hypothetical protein